MPCCVVLCKPHLNLCHIYRYQVREFSGITDTARRTLTSMARRDVKQKFILVFIAVILIIAIAVTVYYTTQKKKE